MNKLINKLSMLGLAILLGLSWADTLAFPSKLAVFQPQVSLKEYISFKDPKSTIKLDIVKGKISDAIKVDYTIIDWGGIALTLTPFKTFKKTSSLFFAIKGDGKKNTLRVEITDNGGERFESLLVVDFVGWKTIAIPFKDFVRRKDWQPEKAPDNGLTLTAVEGIGFSPLKGVGSWQFMKVGVVAK